MMHGKMKYLTYLPLLFLLGACTTLEDVYSGLKKSTYIVQGEEEHLLNHNRCPDALLKPELSIFTMHPANTKLDPENISNKNYMSRAYIEENAGLSCSFEDETVTVDLTLNFRGELGKKGKLLVNDDPLYTYPYFVAITDRSGDITLKEYFIASLHYPSEGNEATYTETVRQIIPLANHSKARDIAVVAGFQLTENQLKYNRNLLKAMQIEQAQQDAAEAAKAMTTAKPEANTNAIPVPSAEKAKQQNEPIKITN